MSVIRVSSTGTAIVMAPEPAFCVWFKTQRRRPFSITVLEARFPLVMAHIGVHSLREAFVQTARTIKHPELYIEGVHLAAMGGHPYADWN